MKISNVFFIMSVLVLSAGCSSTRKVESARVDVITADTLIHYRIEKQEVVTIPSSSANLRISEDQLRSIPEDAVFMKKESRASVVVAKKNNIIEVTATCDSLNIIVESLESEIIRLKHHQINEMSETVKEITIKEPSGLQWFQIWGFRLMLVAIALYVILKKVRLFNF